MDLLDTAAARAGRHGRVANGLSSLRDLYLTLSQRRRPEDVAQMILELEGLGLAAGERALLERAGRGSLKRQLVAYTSMLEDFARPQGLVRQVAVARQLFRTAVDLTAADCAHPATVEGFLAVISRELGKAVGASDFAHHRLNRLARKAEGVELSRRRYNKMFRLLGRMEQKLAKLHRELLKIELFQVGKSALATRLGWDDFSVATSSACFVAYYTARANLRSEFTITGQQKPYDEIARMLFRRCQRDPRTSYWAIAHVHPAPDVLAELDDEHRGQLLGVWFAMLQRAGGLLDELWRTSRLDRGTMIVRRGNDSTTWNQTAGAWNRARAHWIAVLEALGRHDVLDALCPGKVMKLVAADVAAWHRAAGGGLDPDTAVWMQLPPPWKVVAGEARCTREEVARACRRAGVDPVARGWVASAPLRTSRYRATPELVHGVAVSNPVLATLLRQAGWCSGKP
jgi:hypothetical protein